MKPSHWLAVALAVVFLSGSASGANAQDPVVFQVTSPAMLTGELMPRDFSPDGRNLSPPLEWSGLPEGTRQIAVLCEDFGAGNPAPWVHWIVYNIPGTATGLPEGLPIAPTQPMPASIAGAVHGKNGWGRENYRGPAPPGQTIHHYNFRVYALDSELNLPPGLERDDLLAEIAPHIIGRGVMIPMYWRQRMPGAAPLEE